MAINKGATVTQQAAEIKTYYGKTPVATVVTFGCQQNISDSEHIMGVLQAAGFSLTEQHEKADFVVYNTCAIREHAELKTFGKIGELKKLKAINSKVILCVCGCMSEQESVQTKLKNNYPFIDIVLGTNAIGTLLTHICTHISTRQRVMSRGAATAIKLELPKVRPVKFKANVNIMQGCNNFCSYCIVPYVRGRETSREPEAIYAEVEQLVKNGCKEITLLGQNVNSYGTRLDRDINFVQLLDMLCNIEGDFWLRFMSSHPKDATVELFEVINRQQKICKSVHLPVQSGNSDVLRAMNRQYTAEAYMALLESAHAINPDITFSSDFIIGFPGETQAQFEDTMRLIEKARFMQTFNFIYSKRKGTKAALLEDTVDREQKIERMRQTIELQEKISAQLAAAQVGKRFKALVESELNGVLTCRTSTNYTVTAAGASELIGNFVTVEVTKTDKAKLSGNII